MSDTSEAILVPQNNKPDKQTFAQRFRERLVYPFQKKRFIISGLMRQWIYDSA